MPDDGRPAQALEDAELDFVGSDGNQLIETACKAVDIFAWQAGNQVGVQMRMRMFHQPADVGGRLLVVLFAADQRLHFRVEALHSDFQLQSAGREFRKQFLQAVGQMIGYYFKVDKNRIVRLRSQLVEEELQDAAADIRVQIESAVDELELARSSLIKQIHFSQKAIQIETPCRLVQR